MLTDIFKKSALKWGVIGGILSPALLLFLLFNFPENSPYTVFSVSSMLVYSFAMIFSMRSYKSTFGENRFALKDGFLSGALATFLSLLIAATIIYFFFTWQSELFELLKKGMIPEFSVFESPEQGETEYQQFIKDINALETTALIRTEITKKPLILFFVNILGAAYFRTS